MGIFSRKTRRAASGNAPRPHCRPQIEALEDRCLLSAGALDPTFGVGGKVTTDMLGKSNIYSEATGVALQTDGKVIVAGFTQNAGRVFGLARYNTDGSLDTSFGIAGQTAINFGPDAGQGPEGVATDVVVQGDGKIVVIGFARSDHSDYDFAVARLNSDGTLDTSFDGDGKRLIDFSDSGAAESGRFSDDLASGVVVQTDGKIILVGSANPGPTFRDLAVARLNADGSMDESFSGDGKQAIDLGSSDDAVYGSGVAVQTDGKIVVAGYTEGGGVVARLNSDGTLDNSFDSDGKQTLSLFSGNNGSIQQVAVQSDGKILVAGYSYQGATNYDFAVGRLNSDGSVDTSFDGDGKTTIDFSTSYDVCGSLALQADGKIVLAGVSGNDFAVARLNGDGALDTTFSSDGKQTIDFGSMYESGADITVQADGKIVVAGSSYIGFAVARLDSTGTLDNSFDGDGKVVTGFSVSNSDFVAGSQSVVTQADGKIVVVGYSDQSVLPPNYLPQNDFAVARYNADGTLDDSFGVHGRVIVDFGSDDDRAFGITLQADGKIVVVGYTYQGTTNHDFAVVRLNGDGGLDTSFDGDGKLIIDFGADDDVAYGVAIQDDSKIVLAGYSYQGATNYDFAVARLNGDGGLDTSFDGDGKQTVDFGGDDDKGYGVAVQVDGMIVVAGYSYQGATNYDFAVARLKSDGSLDTSFDGNGKQSLDFGTDDDECHGVAVQTDGKIVLAGYSYQDVTNYDFAVARLNSNGSLDTSFDGDGKQTLDIGYEDFGRGLALQGDGKIVVAGYSNMGVTSYDFAIVRLNSNGSIDAGFGSLQTGQYACSVIDNSSQWSSTEWSAAQALGAPDTAYGDLPSAWAAEAENGTAEFLTLGFASSVYSDGVTIRETLGNGFVTQVDLLDVNDVLHTVWSGIDPSSPGSPVDFQATWVLTDYLVKGVKIYVDTDHDLDSWEEIDSVRLHSSIETRTGKQIIDFGSDDDAGYGVAVQADGNIVVAGSSYQPSTNYDFAVARLLGNNDTDGVTDIVEDAAPNGGDGNADGIPDSQQANVTSLPNSADGRYVTLETPAGTSLDQVSASANPSPGDAPAGAIFPIGFLDFAIQGVGSGSATTVTLYLPTDVTANTYYKYGPTADNTTPHWYEFQYDGTTGAVIDNDTHTITLHLVDGGRGDDDLTANGQILDPGSPALVNRPPVADAGGPQTITEGDTLTLNAGTSVDPDGDALTYSWDLNGDGNFNDAAGVNPTLTWSQLQALGIDDGPSIFNVTVRLDDGHEHSVTSSATTLTVNNTAPTVSLTGDVDGVRGQTRTFLVGATDPSSSDQDAGFTYTITWSDGTQVQTISRTASNGAGTSVDHVFTASGTYTLEVIATDKDDGHSQSTSASITIQAAELQGNDLAVGGTLGNDTLVFSPQSSAGDVTVKLNGDSLGTFHPTGYILAYGQAGDDDIQVASGITLDTMLFGGDGNDRLKGGSGNNIEVGGLGDDLLVGGNNRDILIGGAGADRIVGNAQDDLLVAGWTLFDNNPQVLSALMAEWSSTHDYATRLANLQGTDSGTTYDQRLNGNAFLTAGSTAAEATVFDDDAQDVLTGSAGQDWFWANYKESGVIDKITDLSAFEFANDLEFINS